MQYPEDYAIQELAGTTVSYSVTSRPSARASSRNWTTSSRRISANSRTWTRLRARVRGDLEHEATHEAERDIRGELFKQLASRVTFDVPAALLDREIDRRMEDFVRRLMDQQIDPMKININWEEFREKQREAGGRSCARRTGPRRGGSEGTPLRRATRTSTRKWSATPSAAGAARPPSGRNSRRRVELHAFTRGCVAKRR